MALIEEVSNGLPKPKYEYITTEETLKTAMSELDKYPEHSIDTETTGLDVYKAKLCLVQIGAGPKNYVIDTRYDTERSNIHPEMLLPVLEDKSKVKILQNAAYDMKMIKLNMGIYLENVYDTMIVEQLLNLGLYTKVGLAALVERYLSLTMPKEPRGTFSDYYQPYKDFQLEYAANDVVVLPMIKELQWSDVQKEGLEHVSQLEFDFLKPLCEMELNGVLIDIDKWKIMMEDWQSEHNEAKLAIQKELTAVEEQSTLFGVSLINIDSNVQLKKALNKYGLNLEDTNASTLAKFKGVPIIDAVLSYRKNSKLISTYGDALLERIQPSTGRLHTSFKQMVSTGRMSSSNPNLQNIPKQQKYRSCFVAPEGYSMITADGSNFELRILANLSQEPAFIETFLDGKDLHTRTAADMFKVPYDEVKTKYKKYRNAAKAINFGLCINENSQIITNKGVIKIKDIEVGSAAAHDKGSDVVIDKAYMGDKEVFEIETKYGYTIEATEDHLMKVINKEGQYVDKKLKDLNLEEDYVCIKKKSNLFSTEVYKFEKFEVEKVTNYKHFDLPEYLTEEWAAFLGLFIAEGSVQKIRKRKNYGNVSFGFSKDNLEFIDKCNKLFGSLFGDRVSTPEYKYKIYSMTSVLFASWLANICNIDYDNKTNNITIPDCIKYSSREYQIVFLKWLFEGDGTVKANGKSCKVVYNSNSLLLVKDLQIMLLNFGILSSITEEEREGVSGYYILSLVGYESINIFKNEIGFVTAEKNDKIISNINYNRSSYFIGNHEKRMEKVMKNRSVSKQLKDRFYKSRYKDTIGNVYLKELSKYDNFFKFIYDNGIVSLPIKQIKSKGVKPVYDLSIENHQYFLANGFIVHNCYGMSAVGLAARLEINKKEAEEIIEKYFNTYPVVKKFLDKSGTDAIKYRFSKSITGRKRYYNMPPYDHPDRRKIQGSIERAGKNMPIQATNADVIKKAMVLLVEKLKPYDARLVLTVHDEVVVEVKNEQREEVSEVVANSIIDAFAMYFSDVPMETDAVTGPCWIKEGCKCGCSTMEFAKDPKYGTRLVCAKCRELQD